MADKADAEPTPLSLGPREWLPFFPEAPPPARGRADDALRDPARAAREADPLDVDALIAALAPAPSLAGAVQMQRSLAPYTSWYGLHMWLLLLGNLLPLAPAFVFNDGRFSVQAMAAGAVAHALLRLYPLPKVRFGRDPGLLMKGSLDTHPMAGLARWFQLLREGPPPAPLVEHDPEDDACPCPLPACAGRLALRATVIRAAYLAVIALLFLAHALLLLWTPAVTLADQTWSHAWSAILIAVAGFFSDPDSAAPASSGPYPGTRFFLWTSTERFCWTVAGARKGPPAEGCCPSSPTRHYTRPWRVPGLRRPRSRHRSKSSEQHLQHHGHRHRLHGVQSGSCLPAFLLAWALLLLFTFGYALVNAAAVTAEVFLSAARAADVLAEIRALAVRASLLPRTPARSLGLDALR
ncbi:hypothetical protein DFJ74DRAFT_399762 [Hyaloraphidium curvatum]|nr:hypothetical protein DFJ74DRAFT_399762 [Hyaloraphidium curvatum]